MSISARYYLKTSPASVDNDLDFDALEWSKGVRRISGSKGARYEVAASGLYFVSISIGVQNAGESSIKAFASLHTMNAAGEGTELRRSSIATIAIEDQSRVTIATLVTLDAWEGVAVACRTQFGAQIAASTTDTWIELHRVGSHPMVAAKQIGIGGGVGK